MWPGSPSLFATRPDPYRPVSHQADRCFTALERGFGSRTDRPRRQVWNTIVDELTILAPNIVRQLEAAFCKNRDFVNQIRSARVARVTFDPDADAGYIYVRSGRELNAVERNVIGVKHAHTMEVPGETWMNVDLDNFERLMGIEILGASPEIATHLTELSKRYP
jgi:uncharacterized protein YuzE